MVTRHGGYLLEIPDDWIDLRRFETLLPQGRQARREGDDERASRLLRSALSLWRGPVLLDIDAGHLLQSHITRISDARLEAVEQLMETELRLGRHLDIVGELSEIVAANPYHENLHALLMVALYRSSRCWQALQIFDRLRTTLAQELGIDPSPKLQRLHSALLNGDPTLEDPAPRQGLLLDSFAA
ncbi:hypothetical protein GCM10022402_30530 [Salinactinospora qingdaonensis]|uniref:Bacterial transcriptional activator domain-containing protein n=1 Tax=Salinactinospora qingdaonensis TaxID=702744 RepID=A0ABP7FV47_9ACTN